jgi:voltage-gated sodium channel
MAWANKIVTNRHFQSLIIGLILLNALVLGLLTFKGTPDGTRGLLVWIDRLCLIVFVVEITLKLVAWRSRFVRDGWNIFDFIVVGVALVPASGPLSVLRTLRVLRLLRLATAVPSMRRVITGMFVALPGGASVAGVLLLLYYVGAIIGSSLFAETVPEYFGDVGTTFFTLFKLMTLEGWPDIATVVMKTHPHAWLFFVSFIIFTTFTTLNLLFGIIVDAMGKAKEADARETLAEQGMDISDESSEVRVARIEEQVGEIRAMLVEMRGGRQVPIESSAAGE